MANRPVKITFTQEGLDKVEGALSGVNSKLDQVDTSVRGLSGAGDTAKGGLDKVGSAGRDAADGLDKVGQKADDVDTKAMGFRDTMTGVQDTMLGVGKIAKGELFEGFLTLGMGIGDLGSGLYNFVVPAMKNFTKTSIAGAAATVKQSAVTVAHTVASKASAAASKTLAVAQRALNAVMRANPLGLVVTAITVLIGAFVALYKNNKGFRDFVDRMWKSIRAWIGGAVEFVGGKLADAREAIGKLMTRFRSLRDRVSDVMGDMRDRVKTVVEKIGDFFGSLGSKISSALEAARKRMVIAVDNIKTKVINPLIALWNRIAGPLGGPTIKPLQTLAAQQEAAGARFRQRNRGGIIPDDGGPDRDRVPALLTPGEFVMSRKAVRAIGVRTLEALNLYGKVPPTGGDPQRFAAGGIVAAQRFAEAQHGKSYIWALRDCSMFMSAILNVLEGKGGSPWQRRFTTGSIHAGLAGLAAGLGPKGGFSIGSYRGSPGHMAGTLGGVNVEAGGSPSMVKYNRGIASGADHPRFTSHFHATGAGGGIDWRKFITDRIAKLLDRVVAALSGNSFIQRLGKAMVRTAGDRMLSFVGDFEHGTPYVPRTGIARVHRGERITPAAANRAGAPIVIHNHLYIDGDALDVRTKAVIARREDELFVRSLMGG